MATIEAPKISISQTTVRGWLNTIKSWISFFAGFAIVCMVFAVTIRAAFGLDVPYVATMGVTELAYAAGALWLVGGGGK